MTNNELFEPEFNDWIAVLEMGARKHGAKNWLEPNGKKSSHRDMFASIFRHVADAYAGKTVDAESGLHPIAHAICRLNMVYTRQKRGIKHDLDKIEEESVFLNCDDGAGNIVTCYECNCSSPPKLKVSLNSKLRKRKKGNV